MRSVDEPETVAPQLMLHCPFCLISSGYRPAKTHHIGSHTMTITPLDPVVEGHIITFPKYHAEMDNKHLVASTVHAALQYVEKNSRRYRNYNLIINSGEYATQTVAHIHVHIIPRTEEDGLILPWTNQKKG